MTDILSVALRAASFVLMLQAAGTALFSGTFGARLASSAAGVRSIGRVSALLAILAVIGHYVLQAGRMAGDLSGVWSGALQAIVLHSAGGAEAALRIFGLVLVWAGMRGGATGSGDVAARSGGAAAESSDTGARLPRERGLAATAGVVGATLTVVSFTLTGHTAVSADRWFLIVALTAHVLIVAFWFGALPALYLATLREAEPAAAKVVAAFSAAATWIVPGIFIAGGVLAAGLVPGFATFARPYGELLLVKIGGFAVLMMLAASNKWRLTPALARGDRRAPAALRRSLAAEYVLIGGVLTATAVMTTFFSPD